ncbi:uncharacterized protein JCM10292_007118 [Rhodotorula paludigena]|uniref:uncharacterized protein n=1 Tax=Rhodotorula paludigena TaxID=86838 RepID=UPI00317711C2
MARSVDRRLAQGRRDESRFRSTLAHPPPLPLSRVHRLLRPLRASLAHFTAHLDAERTRTSTAPPSHKPSNARRTSRTADDDREWSASSSTTHNKRRRSSTTLAGGAQPASKRLAGGSAPDSSPFKQAWRRRPGRAGTTYGSRRGGGSGWVAGPEGEAAAGPSRLRESAAAPSSPAAAPRWSTADLLRRLESASLSPEAMQRALHVLRAYGNVLEAVYSAMNAAHGEQRRVPSLAECAAREVGRAIEDNVRACLAEGYSLSDDEANCGEEGLGDDSVEAESETSFLNSVEMERSASAQELDLEGAKLQDEWYESCPAYASRWILAEHATSVVTTALGASDAPFGLIECCFDLCRVNRAESEGARFHDLLVFGALSTPSSARSSARSTASAPHLLPLLRHTPLPSSLLTTSLLPALLASSFSDRLFFHSSLSLAALPRGTALRPAQDPPLAVGLIQVLSDVASRMIRAIAASVAPSRIHDAMSDDDEETVDPSSAQRLIDEVLARISTQTRAALPLLLRPDTCDLKLLDELSEALELVWREAGRTGLYGCEGAEDDEALDELRAVALVVELSLIAKDSAVLSEPKHGRLVALASLLPVPPRRSSFCLNREAASSSSESDSASASALHAALTRFLLPSLAQPSSLLPLCDALLSSPTPSTSNELESLARALLAAYLDVPTSAANVQAREEARARLESLERTRRMSGRARQRRPGRVEEAGREQSEEADVEEDIETDYDEPVEPASGRRSTKRRRVALERSPVVESASDPSAETDDEDDAAPAVVLDEVSDAEDKLALVFDLHGRTQRRHRSISAPSRSITASSSHSGDAHAEKRSRTIRSQTASRSPSIEVLVLSPSASPVPASPPPLPSASAPLPSAAYKRTTLAPSRSQPALQLPISSDADDLDLLARRRQKRRLKAASVSASGNDRAHSRSRSLSRSESSSVEPPTFSSSSQRQGPERKKRALVKPRSCEMEREAESSEDELAM